MAELNVEQRSSKRPVWPWIVAVLAVALIIWALAGRNTANVDDTYAPPAVTSNEAAAATAEADATTRDATPADDTATPPAEEPRR